MLERLDSTEGAAKVASRVRKGGRAEAFPDLTSIQERMAALIDLANREMPAEVVDGKRREQLKKL